MKRKTYSHDSTMTTSKPTHLPTHPQSIQCGPLSRDPHGNWWFDATYIGSDNRPEPGLMELEAKASVVALRLAEALDTASRHLEAVHLDTAAAEAKATISAFFEWWKGGTWDENWLLTASQVERVELIQIVRIAHETTSDLLNIVRDHALKQILDKVEAWHGRATRLAMALESNLKPHLWRQRDRVGDQETKETLDIDREPPSNDD